MRACLAAWSRTRGLLCLAALVAIPLGVPFAAQAGLGPAPGPCPFSARNFPEGCIPESQRSVFGAVPFPDFGSPRVLRADQAGDRFTITFAPSAGKQFIRWQSISGNTPECVDGFSAPGCTRMRLEPVETCLWTELECDYQLSSGTPNRQYSLVYTIQYGAACPSCTNGVQVFNSDDFAWGAVPLALLPSDAGLAATLDASPGGVLVGDRFTVTLTARNDSDDPLTDLQPTGPLELSGDGDANVVSGPTPTMVPTLEPGEAIDFVYELEATAGGALEIDAFVEARTELGTEATAFAECAVGRARPAPRTTDADPPATCSLDGGITVEIEACKIDLFVAADTINTRELTGDADPPPDTGYPPGGT